METSLAESQTVSYFPTKWPNGYPKQKDVSDTHIQRQTITKINHYRRTALERSVKSISLGGLNRFYVATIDWLSWGLTTRQPLWVILCRLPEKGRKKIKEIVEEMKERDRKERGTGMKVKKQKK